MLPLRRRKAWCAAAAWGFSLRLLWFCVPRSADCSGLTGALRFRRRLHFRGGGWVDRNRYHSNANGIGTPTTLDVLQENIESDPRRAVEFSIHSEIALRRKCWQLDKSGRGDGH